jgi:hypothetical protein
LPNIIDQIDRLLPGVFHLKIVGLNCQIKLNYLCPNPSPDHKGTKTPNSGATCWQYHRNYGCAILDCQIRLSDDFKSLPTVELIAGDNYYDDVNYLSTVAFNSGRDTIYREALRQRWDMLPGSSKAQSRLMDRLFASRG